MCYLHWLCLIPECEVFFHNSCPKNSLSSPICRAHVEILFAQQTRVLVEQLMITYMLASSDPRIICSTRTVLRTTVWLYMSQSFVILCNIRTPFSQTQDEWKYSITLSLRKLSSHLRCVIRQNARRIEQNSPVYPSSLRFIICCWYKTCATLRLE
jgi:hypothetical protein